MCRGGPDPAIASTVSINENAPDVIPAPAWTTTVNPPTSIVRASPGSWTTPPPSTSPITVLRYLRVTVPPDETMLWVGSTSYCGQSARCDTRCNARGIAPGRAREQLRGTRRVRRGGARLLPCRSRWHSRRPDRLLDDGRHQETGHQLLRLEQPQWRPPRAFTLVPAWHLYGCNLNYGPPRSRLWARPRLCCRSVRPRNGRGRTGSRQHSRICMCSSGSVHRRRRS